MFIISAAKFEVVPVLEMMDQLGWPYDYREAGVGPVLAAASAARMQNAVAGRDVLCLGSAGTFGEFRKPFLVQAGRIHWMPTAERLGLAKNMEQLFPPSGNLDTSRFDLSVKTVLSSTSVSFADGISIKGLPDRKELVENMEAWPLARLLQPFAKSFTMILGITNTVGPEGSKEWERNFKSVATLTADFLRDHLLRDLKEGS